MPVRHAPARSLPTLLLCTAALLFALGGGVVSCGDDGAATTLVSFAVSDAPIGSLEAVVITVDRVTLKRPGDDVVIDEFPADDPDDDPVAEIQIDLLDYQGLDSALIVDGVELEVGDYQDLRLSIVDEDIDASYVIEEGGARKPIKVPSGELKLGRLEVAAVGVQSFVIEFDLQKAMTYNPGPPGPDRYILKPRGVRVVDVAAAALLAGVVDPGLFDGEAPCDAKPDPDVGNVVYLYRGHDLDPAELGDLFDPDVDTDAAMDLVAPYAAELASEMDGAYTFSYLPPGDYTVAFSCDAEGDDADFDDGIVIPTPASELREVSLSPGAEKTCDFPVSSGDCL